MASKKVRYEQSGAVALVTMDDGKVNALSHEMIDALNLDTSLERATALLALKPPAFSSTKERERGAIIADVREGLEEDIARMAGVREGAGAS